jgi:vacuolar iron transporter family protein
MSPKGRPEGGYRSAEHEGSPANLHASWREEQRSAYLYRACAAAEAGTVRAGLFQRLAGEATAQAAIWRAQLTARGHPPPPPYAPDPRARLVARLVRWLGPRRMRPVLSAMKVRGIAVYTASFAPDPGHAAPAPAGAVLFRHRTPAGGGNLRAAMFGVNDGLISNASLILGVAGASGDARLVLMSGVAGLAAGAFAMATGEYVSVRSQRELFLHQVALERDELKQYPEAEAQELALIYAAKGLPQKEATKLAKRLVADPGHALDTLARDELGLDPAELGSPAGAAASSFLAFAAGAALPLVPFLFASGDRALQAGVAVSGAALFAIGATLSLFTGRSAWYSGARMLALGALAGGVTYGLGRLVGVALG